MGAVPEQYLSLQDYFELEATSETKHEYYLGVIYAMTGASVTHNLLVANVISNLHLQLRGKSCTVYPSDLRLKVEATGLYTYPDAQVICGNIQHADERKDIVINPTVLIEVLSPSTKNYDRGMKFQHYRTIETLREYLIIAQDSGRVEHYIRQEAHRWLLVELTFDDQEIRLDSIGCTLTLAAIYEKVSFAEQ